MQEMMAQVEVNSLQYFFLMFAGAFRDQHQVGRPAGRTVAYAARLCMPVAIGTCSQRINQIPYPRWRNELVANIYDEPFLLSLLSCSALHEFFLIATHPSSPNHLQYKPPAT